MWKLYGIESNDIFYTSYEYISRIFGPIKNKYNNLSIYNFPLNLEFTLLQKSKLNLDFYKELLLYSYSKMFFDLNPSRNYIFIFSSNGNVYKINGNQEINLNEDDIIFSFNELENYVINILNERKRINVFLPQIITFSLDKNLKYNINNKKEINTIGEEHNIYIFDYQNKNVDNFKLKRKYKTVYFMDYYNLKITDDLNDLLLLKLGKKNKKNTHTNNIFVLIDLKNNSNVIETENNIYFVIYNLSLSNKEWIKFIDIITKKKIKTTFNFLFKYDKYYILGR
jgi:hypothetical protein